MTEDIRPATIHQAILTTRAQTAIPQTAIHPTTHAAIRPTTTRAAA